MSTPPTGLWSTDGTPAGTTFIAGGNYTDLVIAGTQIVPVDMPNPGQDMTLSDSFKITEALPVIGPGANDPEPVTSAPTLTWGDDSSENFYTVVVFNAYGEIVWCLGAVGEIGQAKDTAQALLKAGPGDLYRHRDEQAPRQHLDGNVTEITQRLLHVPD